MASIADIFFTAALDDTRLQVDAKRAGQKAGTAAGSGFQSKFSALKQGIGLGIGTTLIGAVGGAVTAVTDFMHESIDAASDLNESASKSVVVFGDAADEIDQFADTAAQSLGLSKQAALEAASTFGNFFTGLGQSQQVAADMSKKVVTLAGDLASFNNLDPGDVLEKLRSGLTGEAEPLRSVGVFLTEAKVKAKGMELGLADAHGELSEGAKVLARYQIILDETKTAQGDFARTSDGLANQERILNAELENTRAQVGQDLIPAQLAWEKGNLDIIRTIRGINDVTKSGEVPRNQLIDDMQSLLRVADSSLGPFGDFFESQIASAKAEMENAEAAKEATVQLGRARGEAKAGIANFDGLTKSTKSAYRAFKDAQRPGATLSTLLRDLGYHADQTDDAISDLAGTIADELFGDAINAGNEARLKEEIKDLRDQRSEVKKNSPKWKELTGQIAENEQALFDLHLEEAKKKGPAAVIAFLQQEKSELRKSNTAARKYIDSLIALYSLMIRYNDLGVISFGRYTGKIIPRAEGGRVDPSHTYVVGEEHPEIFVPDTAGTIYPDVGSALSTTSATSTASTSGWGSMGPISINVDARGLPNAHAVGSAVRQGVHDAMADVLRQQNARLPTGSRS